MMDDKMLTAHMHEQRPNDPFWYVCDNCGHWKGLHSKRYRSQKPDHQKPEAPCHSRRGCGCRAYVQS